MKLINEKVSGELTKLLGFLFVGNSIFDNASYKVGVNLVMPRTANIIHHNLAHWFPVMADIITDYTDSRNLALSRPEVPKSEDEYENIKEVCDKLLEYMIDLEKLSCSVCQIAHSEGDMVTKLELDKFIRKIVPKTKIMLDLCDYIEMNGYSKKDAMFMDFAIYDFLEGNGTKYKK